MKSLNLRASGCSLSFLGIDRASVLARKKRNLSGPAAAPWCRLPPSGQSARRVGSQRWQTGRPGTKFRGCGNAAVIPRRLRRARHDGAWCSASASGVRRPVRSLQHEKRQERQRRAAALLGAHEYPDRRALGPGMDGADPDRAESSAQGVEAGRERVGPVDHPETAPRPQQVGAGADPGVEPPSAKLCALALAGTGEGRSRRPSKKGGFVTTTSARFAASPAARRTTPGARTSAWMTRRALQGRSRRCCAGRAPRDRARARRGRRGRRGSRRARPRPTAPVAAPTSQAQAPSGTDRRWASRAASVPARCAPRGG